MFIQKQFSIFDYEELEALGDLERLKLVIENAPDEEIIRKLRKIRGKGRNDWSVEGMWNAFLASYVYGHHSVSSLIRELSRNSDLRKICGLYPTYIKQADGTRKLCIAPSEAAFSRFISNLLECKEEVEKMFNELVKYMYENLEGFGEDGASDGKELDTYATKNGKNAKDRRGDADAKWGVKKYTESTNDKGEKLLKKETWFGFRLHLIVDSNYELPIAFKVTPAPDSEKKVMLDMLKELKKERPEVIEKMEKLTADKGYDYTELIKWLEEQDIVPYIDIQNKWKDGESTKQYKDTDLVYTYDGKVYYVNDAGKLIKLLYEGYDKATRSLKYKFPPAQEDKRVFRIKIDTDRRIFTPVPRDCKKWKREYKKRTSVERENGRIDRDLGFELHTIRGQAKMEMCIGIGFIVQLSMAKGKIEENKKKLEEGKEIDLKGQHLSALVA